MLCKTLTLTIDPPDPFYTFLDPCLACGVLNRQVMNSEFIGPLLRYLEYLPIGGGVSNQAVTIATIRFLSNDERVF